MAKASAPRTIGNRIAPPRFVLFSMLLAAALGAGVPTLGWRIGTMAAFDAAAVVFLITLVPLFARSDAGSMRAQAEKNDANRALLLALTVLVTSVVLSTVAAELGAKEDVTRWSKPLIIATLAMAWLFSNAVYALHYAHLYYSKDEGGRKDARGLDFAGGAQEPLYWDFVYFAFTLGMTFQTSDTEIASPRLRKVATLHSLTAFAYNIGVLAFTINVLGK